MNARRLTSTGLLWLCALTAALAFAAAPAGAAVTRAVKHEYLKQFGPIPEGAAIPGPLDEEQGSMVTDSGHVWIAGKVSGTGSFRVDEFDAATGGFISQFASAGVYTGVAVGHLPGEAEPQVYLAESSVLGVYDEAGAPQATWTGEHTPATSFGSVGGVAVDNSTSLADWAGGDVFVADPANRVVDVFAPKAGSKDEERYVTQLTGTGPGEEFVRPEKVAVNDANGDLIVLDEGKIDLFEPTLPGEYSFVRTLSPPSAKIVFSAQNVDANDGEGDIYALGSVEEDGERLPPEVFEFDSAGEYLGRVSSPAGEATSVAGDPVTHGVFIGARSSGEPLSGGGVYAFGPTVVLPGLVTAAATGVTPSAASLNGAVDLEGAGAATCRFAWGTTKALAEVAPCAAQVTGAGENPVSVDLTGLEPDTTYYYRLQATSANGTNAGEPWQDGEFTTPGPGIHAQSAAEVTASSATLNATVDPDNSPTTVYFQYGTSTGYGSTTAVEQIGSGKGDVTVPGQALQGLRAGSVYHYRVVALSELEGGTPVAFYGEDHTFTTQPGGSSLALLDNRQWEMVSTPNKQGALIRELSTELVTQAAVGGGGLTYLATAPTELEPQGDTNYVQVLSTRGADGWSSRDIAPPHGAATGTSIGGNGEDYRLFSTDLSMAAVQPLGPFVPCESAPGVPQPCLSPDASGQTPFLHDLSSGLYTPLVTGCPEAGEPCPRGVEENADVPAGTDFEENLNRPNKQQIIFGPQIVGANGNLSDAVLEATVPLTQTTFPGIKWELYEWSSGHLALVSVLPPNANHEELPANEAVLGQSTQINPQSGELSSDGSINTRHAISEDGSRVIFSARGHLYLRDTVAGKTIELDEAESCGGCTSGGGEFQRASSDGSKVFFTDTRALTPGAHGNDLYLCEIVPAGEALACRLKDIAQGISAGSTGISTIPGISEDGSTVYYVAGTGMYLARESEGWTPKLVAVLSAADEYDWRGLVQMPVRVSPDGQWLAFMSQQSLTGYDNEDVTSLHPGERLDAEVYLYSARTGKLVCASCNPTGARPAGTQYAPGSDPFKLFNETEAWPGQDWVAASVPGWLADKNVSADYQPDYLSDGGRVFFDAADALVPQDVDGTEDVYEFEPAGAGTCTPASGTYSAASGGCADLISSGSSAEESAFLGASESGADVFFLTTAKLASQDYDSSYDVYDAHECTSESPCPPPAAEQAPACTTEASCKAAPAPQPSIYGHPSSATFSGAGNLQSSGAPGPPKKVTKKIVKCKKGFTKNKKNKCVKSKKKAKKAKKASRDRRGK
jgi:hypothetical protein